VGVPKRPVALLCARTQLDQWDLDVRLQGQA